MITQLNHLTFARGLLALVFTSLVVGAEPAKKSFDIPAGPAQTAMQSFTEQSGLQIAYPTEIMYGVQTNAVKGMYIPKDAAEKLLEGTTLKLVENKKTGGFTITRSEPKNVGRAIAPTASDRSTGIVKADNDELRKLETIVLDPFKVTSDTNVGYGAQMASSSSRLNLRYIDVPQTVNVVTAEFLTDAFIFDSRDFTKYLTNVTPRTNSHQTETFYMRGLQTTTSYVEGFLITQAVNRDSALYNRVEYVKGPASAAIGRGEAGGLVNFIQKKPDGRRRASAVATVGTDEFYRAEVDFETPLLKNGRLSLRMPMYYQASKDPRDPEVLSREKYGVGPALTWQPFERTEINVMTAFFSNSIPGITGNADYMHKDLIDMRVDLNGFNPNIWYPSETTPLVPFSTVYGFNPNYRRNDVAEGSIIITHKFNDSLSLRQGVRAETITTTTKRFGSIYPIARNPAMPSGYSVTLRYLRDYLQNEGLRSQTNLLYEKQLTATKHTLVLGYDAYLQESVVQRGQRDGIVVDLYNPKLTPPVNFDPETWVALNANADQTGTGDGYGYYGQYLGSFFSERIMAMAGWRQDRTNTSTFNKRNGSKTVREETTAVPRYSISYKPAPWMSVYYLYSEQADPPRITNRWSADSLTGGATSYTDGRRNREEFISGQVHATLHEIGLKAEYFGGRLTSSIALYDISRDGFIQNEVRVEPGANGMGFIQYTENFIADGEHVQGVELEVFGQPTPRLTLFLSAVLPKGENPRADGTLQPMDILMDEVSLHGKYSLRDRQGNGFEFTAGGKYWFGGWPISNASLVTFKDDQYSIDVGVGYYWKGGRYNLRLRANNVLDDVIYITENSQYGLRRVFMSLSTRF